MIKYNHLWYLLHICCDFAILVNPFFRAVLVPGTSRRDQSQGLVPSCVPTFNVPGIERGSFIKLDDTLLQKHRQLKRSLQDLTRVTPCISLTIFTFLVKFCLCGIYIWPPFTLSECDIVFLPCRSQMQFSFGNSTTSIQRSL